MKRLDNFPQNILHGLTDLVDTHIEHYLWDYVYKKNKIQ